eukprot:2118942-Pleurochrysis_carterae.AAC.1
MSIVDTTKPRPRSDSGSVDSAEPSPLKTTRALLSGESPCALAEAASPTAGKRPARPPPAPPAACLLPPRSRLGRAAPSALNAGRGGRRFGWGGRHVCLSTVARTTCRPGR